MTTSRGVRNNNPGNIDYNKANKWDGQLGLEPKTASIPNPRFALFDSPENGIRALAKLLLNYQTKQGTPGIGGSGIDTVRETITRWAPGNENDTEAYVQAVAKFVGIPANQSMDVHNKDILLRLVTAVIRHENGSIPYGLDVIMAGVSRALK